MVITQIRRWFASACVLVGVALPLTACASPVACSAIGYVPNITVNLTGRTLKTPEVQGCADGSCSQTPVITPGGTNDDGKIKIFEQKKDVYSVSFTDVSKLPTSVLVRVFDNHVYVTQQSFKVKWVTRTDRGCDAGWQPIHVDVQVPAA